MNELDPQVLSDVAAREGVDPVTTDLVKEGLAILEILGLQKYAGSPTTKQHADGRQLRVEEFLAIKGCADHARAAAAGIEVTPEGPIRDRLIGIVANSIMKYVMHPSGQAESGTASSLP